MKQEIEFEDYKNYQEANRFGNVINYTEKIILLWEIWKKITKNS